MPEILTSDQNPLLKDVRRAARQGGLTSEGLAIAEGPHLVKEVVRSAAEVRVILAAESFDGELPASQARVVRVADAVFAGLAATETPQGVLALVKPAAWTMEQLLPAKALVVILDGIQDPGNAGAILRAAEAFGATGAIFRKGSVFAYHPRCIRGSAGSVFRLPVVATQDLPGIPLFGADAHASRLASTADLREPCGLVIGSEGRGISPELAARASAVRIPTQGVESLNAAVAAGILLYEAARQRSSHEPLR